MDNKVKTLAESKNELLQQAGEYRQILLSTQDGLGDSRCQSLCVTIDALEYDISLINTSPSNQEDSFKESHRVGGARWKMERALEYLKSHIMR
jgi:hypothetical protein